MLSSSNKVYDIAAFLYVAGVRGKEFRAASNFAGLATHCIAYSGEEDTAVC